MINGKAPGPARDIEAEELETYHRQFPPGSEMLPTAHLIVWWYDSFTGRGRPATGNKRWKQAHAAVGRNRPVSALDAYLSWSKVPLPLPTEQ